MIDITTCKISSYRFKDGDATIETKNPSQALYTKMLSMDMDNPKECIGIVDSILDDMLYNRDRHYKEDLSFDVKIMLVKDYFEYHMAQLEQKFPSAFNSR